MAKRYNPVVMMVSRKMGTYWIVSKGRSFVPVAQCRQKMWADRLVRAFNCDHRTIGYRCKNTNRRINLDKIDWTYSDTDLARMLGCTREYMRQQRAKQGQPRSRAHCQSDIPDKLKNIDTSVLTIREIANILGVQYNTARGWLSQLQLPYKKRYFDMSQITDYEWEKEGNAAMGRRLGMPSWRLANYRCRCGKPPCPGRRRRLQDGSGLQKGDAE